MNLPTLIAAADGVHAVDIATLARIDASTARPRPLNDGQKAFDRDSFFQTHDAYDIAEASTSSSADDADVVHVFTLTNDAREALVRDLVPLGLRKFRRGREDAARSLGDPVPGPGSDVSVVRSNRGGYQSYADLLDSDSDSENDDAAGGGGGDDAGASRSAAGASDTAAGRADARASETHHVGERHRHRARSVRTRAHERATRGCVFARRVRLAQRQRAGRLQQTPRARQRRSLERRALSRRARSIQHHRCPHRRGMSRRPRVGVVFVAVSVAILRALAARRRRRSIFGRRASRRERVSSARRREENVERRGRAPVGRRPSRLRRV